MAKAIGIALALLALLALLAATALLVHGLLARRETTAGQTHESQGRGRLK